MAVITVFLAATVLFLSAVALLNVAILILDSASPSFRSWWRSPPVRVFMLGGVTTLKWTMNYPCTMCQESMVAGEEVRTLSCGHAFHRGGTVKCRLGIDAWLLAGNRRSCPICRQLPRRVRPWKRTPPSSSALPPQASNSNTEEEDLVFPSHWFDETLLQADPEPAELLFPSHWFDETLLQARVIDGVDASCGAFWTRSWRGS